MEETNDDVSETDGAVVELMMMAANPLGVDIDQKSIKTLRPKKKK